jgi:hypothetical protein
VKFIYSGVGFPLSLNPSPLEGRGTLKFCKSVKFFTTLRVYTLHLSPDNPINCIVFPLSQGRGDLIAKVLNFITTEGLSAQLIDKEIKNEQWGRIMIAKTLNFITTVWVLTLLRLGALVLWFNDREIAALS